MNPDTLLGHFGRISEAPEAIAQLRRFILELAVRGKLVEQDPSDEPASELLKRIRSEKALLLRSGLIRHSGKAPLSSKEQFHFDIPQEWTWTTLGESTQKITDGAHKTPTYVDKGIPFISVKDFSKGKLNFSSTRFISPEEHEVLYRRCDPLRGDILIGRIGTLGKAVLVDTDEKFSLFVSVGLIRFSHDSIVPTFFHHLLNSPHVEGEFNRIKVGGGSHTNKLNLSDLNTVVIPLPPLAEQHRIVAKVDELMVLCDQLEAAKAAREQTRERLMSASLHYLSPPADDEDANTSEDLRDHARFVFANLPRITTRPGHIKQLRQTILNLGVQGKLVPQDPNDEPASELLKRIKAKKAQHVKGERVNKHSPLGEQGIPFAIPNLWTWARLGEICSKTGSGSTPRGGKEIYVASGIPFLRSQNVYDDGLHLEGIAYISDEIHGRMNGSAVAIGDLLLNITGGSIGRCAIVPEYFETGNVSQHVAIVRPAIGDLNVFLHKVIVSPYFQSKIIVGQTGAGRGGLPKNRMDNIAIPLPPLAEQHRIVAKVDELMYLCDQIEAQILSTEADSRRLLEAALHEALQPTLEETLA